MIYRIKISIVLIFLLFLASINSLMARNFILPQSNQALTFKEMQLQFNDWKNSRDISQEKGWKYFKRWEMETQLHTNSNGEPVNPEVFINEVTRLAEEKEILKSSNSDRNITWLPAGRNALPNNLTGYMENGIGRINCITFDPNSPSTYYVGVAQGGLWKTSNNGASWLPLTDDLPITQTWSKFSYIILPYLTLDIGRWRNTDQGSIYLSTFGRGIWQADLSVVSEVKNAAISTSNVSLYPSINDGNFNITHPDFKNMNAAQIFDITGRMVAELKLEASTTQISLNAAPGKYFVKMQGINDAQVKSFIIQK
jgi:hypothetical protein